MSKKKNNYVAGYSTTIELSCVAPFNCGNTIQQQFKKKISFLALLMVFITGFSSCTQNNVKIDDTPKKHFEANQLNGCFAICDNGTGDFTIYNLKRYRDSTYLPASTFKIINSLIGLQTGIISSDSMVIPWDGVARRAEWDKNLNMYQAFRVSAVPYYQEVARRIGKDSMQSWLNKLKYGTGKDKKQYKISTIDSFWLDNSLKITPDQNLGVVKQLYFNELPFFKVYQEKVKNAMLFEDNSNYKLAYKTGWATTDKGHALGWVVGWIEENKHPYFFVLNLESPNPNYDMDKVRLKMLKDILAEYGFFKGVM